MSEPPAGWTKTTLGELGRYLNGRAFKKSEWAESGRPIIRTQNLTGTGATYNYFQGEVEDRYVARTGDLLVSWAATLGAYLWTGPEAVVNQHIFKVESNIDRRFHKYLLDYKLDELRRHTHGSGMVHITRGKFDAVPVLIPEAPEEQQRIVAILEDHLSRLDAAERGLARSLAQARSLAWKAVHRSISECGGEETSLGQVVVTVRNGYYVSRPGQEPDGVPILRIGSVRALRLDLGDLRYSGASAEELAEKDYLLSGGDLLFTRYNGNPELVGVAAVVPTGVGPLTYPDKLIRVVPDAARVTSEFLAMACSVGYARDHIRRHTKTTSGQSGIAGRDLKSVPLHLPTKQKQNQVVASARSWMEGVDRLTHEINNRQAAASRLRQALLEAAFSGRLTGHGELQLGAREVALV